MRNKFNIKLFAIITFCLLNVAGLYADDNGNFPAGTYYFDNSQTKWEHVSMVIGRGDYYSAYTLTQIAGTNIWSYTLGSQWSNANGCYFINAALSGNSGSDYYTPRSGFDANDVTQKIRDFNAGKCFYKTSVDGEVKGNMSLIPTSLSSSLVIAYLYGSSGKNYKCSASTSDAAWNGANLGAITSSNMSVIGEVVSGTGDGTYNAMIPVYFGYKFDSDSENSVEMPVFQSLGSGNAKHQTASTVITFPTTPGNHTMAVWYFSVNDVWDSNNSNNYVANFVIPGFNVTGGDGARDFGSVALGTVSSSATSIAYESYGWTAVTATISGDDAESFLFSDGTQSKDLTQNATVSIKFSPSKVGTHTAKLTLTATANPGATGEKTYTKEITLTGTGTYTNAQPLVYIAKPAEPQDGNSVKLYGFLGKKGCNGSVLNTVTSYGFFYCSEGSVPTTSSTEAVAGTDDIGGSTDFKGAGFEKQIDEIATGCYAYRSYVEIGGTKYLSAEVGHFCVADCVYPTGDTIYVTIDNSLAADIPCELKFNTFEAALDKIKGYEGYYADSRLRTNVVFEVANTGTTYIGSADSLATVTGGSATCARTIRIRNFNYNNPDKSFIIRSKDATKARPTVQHITLRNSRNVTLKDLRLLGSTTTYTCDVTDDQGHVTGQVTVYDNAIDIDNGDATWGEGAETTETPILSNANLRIVNCVIKSEGFTCVHLSGIDGITFENNDINASLPVKELSNENTVVWGASLKAMHCKNVKIVRNDFTGSHATLLWLQGCQNILVMNNVMWNNNTNVLAGKDYSNVAFIRLVAQRDDDTHEGWPSEKSENIGIYYNTLYLAGELTAEDEAAEASLNILPVDFFRLGSKHSDQPDDFPLDAHPEQYIADKIDFKYNNCYSYSEDVPGCTPATTDAFLSSDKFATFCGHIDFNNYWSKYDKINSTPTQSVFTIKPYENTKVKYIDVESLICKNASDPSDLVVRGQGLNLGTKITFDASGQGAVALFNDRLHPSNGDDAIRPKSLSSGGSASGDDATAVSHKGSIKMSVNDVTTQVIKTIDLTGFNLGDGSLDVNCTKDPALTHFSLSSATFDVDGAPDAGTLQNKVLTVTLAKGNAASAFEEEGNLNVVYNSEITLKIGLIGKYSADEPIANGWTLGAYQQSISTKATKRIIWNGPRNTNWDERGNWYKEDGTKLTCVDVLTDDLEVIIPGPNSKIYSDDEKITNYPTLPVFNDNERGDERVNAGEGTDKMATEYARSIVLEYGGSLKGAHRLHGHYTEATTYFTAQRKMWMLVGTVVMPFTNKEAGLTRYLKSGDYYLNALPQVYMHEARYDGATTVDWNNSFSSLNYEVPPTKVYAVLVPDEYGKNKFPASVYYKRRNPDIASTEGDAPKTFGPFNGLFVNDTELPSFTTETSGSWICNTYPANLDVALLKAGNSGSHITIYDYSDWNFDQDVSTGTIKAQEGFLVTGVSSLAMTESMYDNATTERTRDALAENPNITLRISNQDAQGGCKARIKYDELKSDIYNESLDVTKIFNVTTGYESVPDLYVLRYGKKLASLVIPTLADAIPLGVKVKQGMTIKFENFKSELFEEAVLTDVVTGKVTDLLTETYTVTLEKGEYEERFFLNLKVQENMPTSVKEDVADADGSDDIVVTGLNNKVVISSTKGVILQKVYITDMAGRTWSADLKDDHYNEVKINSSEGVYIIKVVGDNMSKTEKVVVK